MNLRKLNNNLNFSKEMQLSPKKNVPKKFNIMKSKTLKNFQQQ